jgi:hypothetical protein
MWIKAGNVPRILIFGTQRAAEIQRTTEEKPIHPAKMKRKNVWLNHKHECGSRQATYHEY